MNLMVMPVPILPGKTEQWQRFRDELRGRWFRDYSESRRRLRVRERAYFYSTPQYGDWVLVTLEGEDPMGAFARFGTGNDEFTRWFVQQVIEIHGFDLTKPYSGPMPELSLDTGSTGITGTSMR